jgi:hypothetical protein
MLIAWKLLRRVADGCATFIFVVAVSDPVGHFFIALAEDEGWYAHPSERVAAVMAVISAVAASPWFHWFGGVFIGFAVGFWIDALLQRRLFPNLANQIDRETLAVEAETLAAAISMLLGDYTSRAHVAWHEDASTRPAGMNTGRAMMANQARVQAQAIERYGEKYHKDVWRVIALAQKCIQLDSGDLWKISHGIRFDQIGQVPTLLTKIAAALRHPQPDLPMLNRLSNPAEPPSNLPKPPDTA